MRKPRQGLRPQVERFESKALLSGAIGIPSAATAVIVPGRLRSILLDGTLRGHFQETTAVPDAGATYDTVGSGHVHGVGHSLVNGTLHSIGFIAQGHAGGDLRLTGAKGTITLQLTGVEQTGGPQPLPDVFSFTVTGGTGKYRDAKDSGTATLVTTASGSQPSTQVSEAGKFTLVLTSNPIPL